MGSAGRWGIVCLLTTVTWATWSIAQRGERGPKLPDLNVNTAADLAPHVPPAAPDRPGPYESRLTSLPVGPEEPTMLQPSLTDVPRPPRDGSWQTPATDPATDTPSAFPAHGSDEVPVDLHQPTPNPSAVHQPAGTLR